VVSTGFEGLEFTTNPHGFLNTAGAGTTSAVIQSQVQAKFTGVVHAQFYRALSDVRIKENIELIEDAEALVKLRQIEPKKYSYVDKVRSGTRQVYGFIAQEVNEVLPEAIGLDIDHIPDVYQLVTVNLENKTLSGLDGKARDGNLKVYTVKGFRAISVTALNESVLLYEGDSITRDDLEDGKVFAYGYEVFDLMTIRKDLLFTINFAATQEIDRRQQAQTVQLETLTLENGDLKSQVQNLVSENNYLQGKADDLATENISLRNRVEELESQLSSLITQLVNKGVI
jgi:hypothetical protein